MRNDDFSGILGVLGVIGCIAAFFLLKNIYPVLATTLLIGGGLVVAGVIAIVIVVLVLAFKKPNENAGDLTTREVINLQKEGRASLIELRKIGMKIKNPTIRKQNDEICEAANQILEEMKNHKESLSDVRRFFSYYLPTMAKILKNYERLEKAGVAEEATKQSTIQCLGDIKSAMDKQYENLFEKYALDLSVEMEALAMACKRDGLISDTDEDEIILRF